MHESPPPGQGIGLHRRSISYDNAVEGDALRVIARLRDERRERADDPAVTLVHELELDVTVGLGDLVITRAVATMHHFPHTECVDIEAAFGQLVGLSVARGYTRAVQERFRGALGCSHLDQLARGLGPAVIQGTHALGAQRRDDAAPGRDLRSSGFLDSMRDTCHIWAVGGPAEQKVALGWRGGRERPVPPVAVFQAEADAAEANSH